MNNKQIIESQAFKAINLLIDQKASELRGFLFMLKEDMKRLAEKEGDQDEVNTRTSLEDNDLGMIMLPVSLYDLKWLSERYENCQNLYRQINDLQRFKLRLLNDYDFTKGDDTEQKSLFGE